MRADVIELSLGLEGFRVIGTTEDPDGVEIVIERNDAAGVCPDCNTISALVHDRSTVALRDLPVRCKPTTLRWVKRRFRCPAEECERKTFTESCPEVSHGARGTRRFAQHLARRARRCPVAHVASEESVSWWRVWKAVSAVPLRILDDLVVRRLGIDEASYRKGLRYHTGFVDLDRADLLDVVPGRTKASVTDWLDARTPAFRAGIREVVIDPFEAYRRGAEASLPHVQVVADKFHAVRLANDALDAVRIRSQRQAGKARSRRSRSPSPSRWARPLYGARRLLLKARERLDERQWARLEEALAADPSGELHRAWQLKESFRDWYLAETPESAREGLEAWYARVQAEQIPEFMGLAKTVRAWETELLAHFTSGATNAATEGITNLVKVVKRDGFGYRNFDNFRRRVLYRCG